MAAKHSTAPAAAHTCPTANQLEALNDRIARALAASYTVATALLAVEHVGGTVDFGFLRWTLEHAVADLKVVHGALDDLRAPASTGEQP
jgi:hypothetical protein